MVRFPQIIFTAAMLSIPVVAMAIPHATSQRQAQSRNRRDAGVATRADASAPRVNTPASGDAGVRADASAPLTPVVAPPPGSPTPVRTLTAPQIAAGVQNFYNRTTDFSADFAQLSVQATTNTRTESRGRVQFRRPGRMRWEYSLPAGNLVVSDGTTLWTHEPANHQAFQANLSQSQLPSALAFLMGTGNLANDFSARMLDATRAYPTGYIVELTPRIPNPSFARLVLYVEPVNYQVVKAGVVDVQNNRNEFTFTNPRVNVNPALTVFQWTPPAGTRVIRP